MNIRIFFLLYIESIEFITYINTLIIFNFHISLGLTVIVDISTKLFWEVTNKNFISEKEEIQFRYNKKEVQRPNWGR